MDQLISERNKRLTKDGRNVMDLLKPMQRPPTPSPRLVEVPNHPFFGGKAVISKEHRARATPSKFSKVHDSAMLEMRRSGRLRDRPLLEVSEDWPLCPRLMPREVEEELIAMGKKGSLPPPPGGVEPPKSKPTQGKTQDPTSILWHLDNPNYEEFIVSQIDSQYGPASVDVPWKEFERSREKASAWLDAAPP